MTRFEVRWFDARQGRVCAAVVEAPDERTARASAGATAVLSARPISSLRHRRRAFDVPWWCEELRTLSEAGMTVVEALETMRVASSAASEAAAVLERVGASLSRGRSLSDSMDDSAAFPPLLIAGVRAGERTGGLISALEDYLRFHRMTHALRQRVIAASIYPTMVLVLGLAITVLLLVVVVPRFGAMYAGMDREVSLPTQVLLWTSAALRSHWAPLLVVSASMAAALAWLTHSGRLREPMASLVEQIGPLRRAWREYRLALFYRSLALLLRGGYVLDQALELCQSLPLGARLRLGLRLTGERMRAGGSVASSFEQGDLTEPVTLRLLAVGERSGRFDRVLKSIAERHSARFETTLDRVTRVVEPLMLFLVAIGVGALVLLLYMPIFEMASGVR